MIYDYICEKCCTEFTVVRPASEYNRNEPCQTCGNPGQRIFSCNIHFIGTKVEDAEFNRGLGKVTKSKNHRDELAKQMGVIEVGNEPPNKIHSYFDENREAKLKKAYDDI